MTTLGLNDHHNRSIINFMKFSRYRRDQHLRVVDICSKDIKESRLSEQIYTHEEVSELLDHLHSLLRTELESELINAAHTNILLLQQMFEQAEKWHLKLQVDISQLENKELLDKIKDFEEQELRDQRDFKNPPSPLKIKLEPVSQTEGPIALLNFEIEKLRAENEKLKSRLSQIETQASSYLQDKHALNQEISNTKSKLSACQKESENRKQSIDIDTMEEKVNQMRQEMEETLKITDENQKHLAGDLTSAKHQLLEVQSQLELAEKELEKKFSQTTTYNNIKKMLVKKNEQIKDLRLRLSRHEDVDLAD